MFISHTSELNEHPSKNAGERTYIERVKEAVMNARHATLQMKQFTAVAEPPSSYDVERVKECNVYVGIHGVRWGSPVHDQPELSYTEQEYEAATAAGIPRLLFLLDPSSSELNLPEEALQDPQYGDRQEAFRRRLLQESGCIVKFFRSPDDLAGLVFRSLKELERLSGYREGGRSDWIWPRAWDFRAYRLQKRQGFVGRQWLFEEVRRWAEDEVSTPGRGQALLITADYGVGKSAFLAELIDTNSAGAKIAAHHFCSTEEDATLSPSVFVRSVAAQLAEALPDYRQLLEADDAKSLRDWLDDADQQQDPQKAFKAFDQSILAPLLSIEAPPQPMLLVVDALDEAQDPRSAGAQAAQATIVQLLARYANRLPPWLKLLATSRRRSDVLKCMQQAFVVKELDAEAGQNLDDLRNYSEERCNSQPLEQLIVSAGMTTTEVAGFLSSQDQCRGKFLYVVLVLNDLEFGLLPLASREDLNDLPSGLEEFYRNAFERRFPPEKSFTLARDILGVLCEAREPIGRRELAAILRRSEQEIKITLEPLHDLLRLQPLTTVVDGERVSGELISFEHVSIAQWLSKHDDLLIKQAGRFAVDRADAGRRIRDWALGEVERRRAYTSNYLVRNLIDHIPEGQREAVQHELLGQFKWLEAKVRHGDIYSLLRDFEQHSSLSHELTIAKKLLQQSSHIISLNNVFGGGSKQLASQLLSRISTRRVSPFWDDLRRQCVDWLIENDLPRPLLASNECHEALAQTFTTPGAISSLCIIHKDLIVISYGHGEIQIINYQNSEICVYSLGLNTTISAMTSFEDSRLVLGCADKKIYLWHISPESLGQERLIELSLTLRSKAREIKTVSNSMLAVVCEDDSLHYYDLETCIQTEVLDSWDRCTTIATLGDGKLLIVNRKGAVLRIAPDRPPLFVTQHQTITVILSLPDESIAFGCSDGKIRIFNPRSRTGIFKVIDAHNSSITSLCTLSDKRLISGSANGSVRVWDLDTRKCLQTQHAHSSAVTGLATVNREHIVTVSSDKTIKIWKTAVDFLDSSVSREAEGIRCIVPVDNNILAYATSKPKVCIARLAELDDTYSYDSPSVSAITALPDGRFATASESGRIQVWDVINHEISSSLSFQGHGERIRTLTVLPNGNLVSGADDAKIRIWKLNSKSAELIVTLLGHKDWIRSVVYLPSGQIASGSDDGDIRIWSLESYSNSTIVEGTLGPVRSLGVASAGRLVVTTKDSILYSINYPTNTFSHESTSSKCCRVTNPEDHCESNIPFGRPQKSEYSNSARRLTTRISRLCSLPTDSVSSITSTCDSNLICGSAGKIVYLCDLRLPSPTPVIAFISDSDIMSTAYIPSSDHILAGDKRGRIHLLDLKETSYSHTHSDAG